MASELLKVTAAAVTAPRMLSLQFSDGRAGLADLSGTIAEAIPPQLSRLGDPEFLANFQLLHGTPTWPGELDLAPEYLYFLCFHNDPSLRDLFSAWGYLSAAAAHA